MGKAELFRQTENHVPDSVLLNWVQENIENFAFEMAYGVDSEISVYEAQGDIRKVIRNAMGVV